MRILIAHSFYRVRGGEDRYVAQQVDLLREAGHDVRLEARANVELPADPYTAARMTYGRREHRRMLRLLDRFEPDIVHLHNPYPSFGPSVHLAASHRRVPLVQTTHNARLRCPNGLMFTEGASCARCLGGAYHHAALHHCFPTRAQAIGYASALWAHRFLLRLDDRVDTFIAPSEFVGRRLEGWGIPTGRIAVIPYYAATTPDPPPVGTTGLSAGRLSPEKGLDVLIQALALLGDPPFEIAGDGPDAGRLTGLASRLGLKRLTFLGELDRDGIRAALDRARYVVMPSQAQEAAGFAGLEAMAAGRPLVASATGGLPELVREGRGQLCVPGSAESLAAAIAAYANDPEAAAADGVRGWAFVREQLTPERHLARLIDAYGRATELAGDRDPRHSERSLAES